MNNSDLLNSIHKRMVNEFLQKSDNASNAPMLQEILNIDQQLRKEIADLYIKLAELGDPNVAINILSDHVAIMVEMINSFKNK